MVTKTLLALGLLLLPIAPAVFVEFRRDLARSYASNGLFPTDATDVVSDVAWLQSYRRSNAGATNGGFSPVTCMEVTDESSGSNVVNVVVGISSCLTDATIAKIKDWVVGIAKTKPTGWKNDASAALKFKFVLHASACAPFSEPLLTRNKLSRLDGFKAYGAVASVLPAPSDDVTAAIMFFADDGSVLLKDLSAYKTLTDYEQKAKVPLAYNFQVNELANNAAAPPAVCSNAKYLASISELSKISLFTAVTRYTCAARLPNSKPFPFLDASGTKRCICTCPSGYELTQTSSSNNKLSCQKLSDAPCGTCVWDAFGPLKFEVTDAIKTCDLSGLMASSEIPVPYLMTTNVADEDKSTDASRQLTVSATPQFSPVYSGDDIANFLYGQQKLSGKVDRDALLLRRPLQLPRSYTGSPKYTPASNSYAAKTSTSAWTKYQESPSANFAKLPITGYGKYKIVATAVDGGRTDSCSGCVAVVDQSRPRATTQCPVPFTGSGATGSIMVGGSKWLNAELTAGNLDRADVAVQQVFAFQSTAANDACSASNRCDDELFERRNFFEDKFVAGLGRFSDGRECFAPKRVWSDFLGSSAAQRSPFSDDSKLQMDVPVGSSTSSAQCTRCCRLNVALKEKWVDYLCDSTYDTERCDGMDSETCAYTQCLTLSGSSAFVVDAQVRPTIKAESESVMKELAGSASTAYVASAVSPTEIHRALACTKFGEKSDDSCTFRSTVSALVSTTAAFKANVSSFASGKEASAFVFWRYRLIGDATWRLLTGASAIEHVFAQSETQITLEAWSQCGLVRAFSFRVLLHVHNTVRVCERFDMMWYQATVARLRLTDAPLCNVPKSDFVELTFDYRPSFGLEMTTATDASGLRSVVTGVVCSASINARPSAEIVRVENAKALEIVRRFAVQLQAVSRTTALTTLNMTCAFTFTRFDKSTTTLTCSKSFSLKDCDAPCANATALNAACNSVSALATCASKQQPGPFDACGGTSVLSATDAKTQLTITSKACCQSCSGGVATSCVALVEVPNEASDGSASLRRCEPQASAVVYAREAFSSASSARAAALPALAFGVVLAIGAVMRRRHWEQLAKRTEAAENAELYVLLARTE